jgi:predicted DNA-binding transcriptional regulator AlpA
MAHEPTLIVTPHQAARMVGLTIHTLQRMRTEGTGPRFIKLGKRRVGYRECDLNEWLESRVATSTADVRTRGLTG